jgi:hypothetical protein
LANIFFGLAGHFWLNPQNSGWAERTSKSAAIFSFKGGEHRFVAWSKYSSEKALRTGCVIKLHNVASQVFAWLWSSQKKNFGRQDHPELEHWGSAALQGLGKVHRDSYRAQQ